MTSSRVLRPPLKRIRPVIEVKDDIVEVIGNTGAGKRPPLRRRRQVATSMDPERSFAGVPVGTQHAAVIERDASAQGSIPPQIGMVVENTRTQQLRTAGTLKLQLPRYASLVKYWKHCIEPIASLLRVRPLFLSRRAHEQAVRLTYAPAVSPYLPTVTFLAVWQYEDARQNLDVIGRNVLPFQYLGFNLDRITPSDLDPDSTHGLAVRGLLVESIQKLDRQSPIARIRSVFVLHDASHMIVVATILYDVGPIAMAHEIADHLNEDLAQARSAQGTKQVKQVIEVNVREEACGGYLAPIPEDEESLVQGGMHGHRAGVDRPVILRPLQEENSEDGHLLQSTQELASMLTTFREERRRDYYLSYRPYDDLFDDDNRTQIADRVRRARDALVHVAINRAQAIALGSQPRSLIGGRTPNLCSPRYHAHQPEFFEIGSHTMSSPAACDSRPSDIDSDSIDLLERMRTVARGTIQDDSPPISRRSSCSEFEFAQDVNASTMTWHAIQNEYSLPDLEVEFWDAVFQEILACGSVGIREKRKVYVDDEEDWEDACFQEYKLRELLEAVHWTGQPPSDICLVGTSTNLLTDHVIKNAQDLE
eukprot:2808286-Amphidinium_carterae.1